MNKCSRCGKTWEFDCPDCAVVDRMNEYVDGALQRSSVTVSEAIRRSKTGLPWDHDFSKD